MKIDLVFAGGGAKGIAHSGAVQQLENEGHQFRRLVGTSAGAITAILLAAGFSAADVVAVFTEKLKDGSPRLGTLKDPPQAFTEDILSQSLLYALIKDTEPSFIPKREQDKFMRKVMNEFLKSTTFRELFSFFEFGGAFAGDAFLQWIQEKLAEKSLRDAPFAEFYQQTGNHVTAVATDVTTSSRLILNHITAPNLPAAWAARMSMSIPLVWQEVVWQKEWGLYRGQDITGHSIVDGGVVSNFPLDLALSALPDIEEAMGGPALDDHAVGLRIDTSLPVPDSGRVTAKKKAPPIIAEKSQFARIDKRMSNLIDTFTRAHDSIVAQTYPNNICRLPAQGYDTMEFDMSARRIQALIDSGAAAMRDFLEAKKADNDLADVL